MSLQQEIQTMGQQALAAAHQLARLSTRKKNRILEAMADALEEQRAAIQEANALDLADGREAGLSPAMLDRLELTDARIDAMVKGLRDVIALDDPVGKILSNWVRGNGLEIQKVSVPIGVIGIIYESRPNVTADATSLCFKSSNAVILRGGKEALRSNQAIGEALVAGGRAKGMPEHAIQIIPTPDRAAVRELVRLDEAVDLIIPRGGEGLIRAVSEMATVPVLKHYKGVCHTYVDAAADPDMALSICENAKCQRPGVCNAMETLLVHKDLADSFLPRMIERFRECGVTLRGDAGVRACDPTIPEAGEEDWAAEYLDLTLAVRLVEGVEQAIEHINRYGSRHSDAIVTEDEKTARIFTQGVDAATVYVNASTRFTDGGEFGMGAEIGVSTDKLHARGPMGLAELTTYKYVILGRGQVRT